MKKSTILKTLLSVAGIAGVTKLIADNKHTIRQKLENFRDTLGEKERELDALTELSDSERILVRAIWDILPTEELDEEFGLADLVELLQTATDRNGVPLLQTLSTSLIGKEYNEENICNAAFCIICEMLTPEEKMDIIIDYLSDNFFDCDDVSNFVEVAPAVTLKKSREEDDYEDEDDYDDYEDEFDQDYEY